MTSTVLVDTNVFTESGLEMTDRLVHTHFHLLREVVSGATNSLTRHEAARSVAV
ncbi:MAG: hypothetical protein ACLPY3_04860 [Solirubrobacteraceae bacterium]